MKYLVVLSFLTIGITNAQNTKVLSSLCMQSATSIIMLAGTDTEVNPVGDKLLRSTNGGTSWHEILIPDIFNVMTFPDLLTGYAVPVVDNNGQGSFSIYKTTDGGETWEMNSSWGPLPMQDSIGFYSCAMRCEFLNSNTGYVGMSVITDRGTSSSAYITSNGGESWKPYDADSLVLENLACNKWVILDSMHFYSLSVDNSFSPDYRSTDGGKSWKKDFEPGFWGYTQYIEPIAHTGLALYTCLPAGKSYEYSIVILRDFGETWNRRYQFTTGSSQNIRKVAFFDSTYGIALSGYSGNYSIDTVKHMPVRTFNGGLTWEVIQSPFPTPPIQYVDCSLWPNGTGYATNAYELVKTTDYGATWFPVSITTDIDNVNSLPKKCGLAQNYPNPVSRASGQTTISYDLSAASHLRLALVDMMGRTVRTIRDEYMVPGSYTERLDVSGLTPSVYLISMFAGNNPPMVRRMVVR